MASNLRTIPRNSVTIAWSDQILALHYLAAVIVREDRIRDLADRLHALASAAPTSEPLVEHHGDQLFHGAGPWHPVPPRLRIREYARALSVLEDTGG